MWGITIRCSGHIAGWRSKTLFHAKHKGQSRDWSILEENAVCCTIPTAVGGGKLRPKRQWCVTARRKAWFRVPQSIQ
jgi:hypothetical protein